MGNRAVVRKGIERARKAIEAYLLQLLFKQSFHPGIKCF